MSRIHQLHHHNRSSKVTINSEALRILPRHSHHSQIVIGKEMLRFHLKSSILDDTLLALNTLEF
jgi:hypothetical protein